MQPHPPSIPLRVRFACSNCFPLESRAAAPGYPYKEHVERLWLVKITMSPELLSPPKAGLLVTDSCTFVQPDDPAPVAAGADADEPEVVEPGSGEVLITGVVTGSVDATEVVDDEFDPEAAPPLELHELLTPTTNATRAAALSAGLTKFLTAVPSMMSISHAAPREHDCSTMAASHPWLTAPHARLLHHTGADRHSAALQAAVIDQFPLAVTRVPRPRSRRARWLAIVCKT